jgi:hypothetical protein
MRILLVAILVTACSSEYPAPKPERPTPPAQNDPSFAISGLKSWYLIGDAARPAELTDTQMTLFITAPSGADYVDAYIPGLPPVRMNPQDGQFALQEDISAVPAGKQDILFSFNGSSTAFAQVSFNRSAAYYVLVSTDYDFSDPGTSAQAFMNWMHRDHPGLHITHFWAPYTYTDSAVTDTRRAELTTWIKEQHEKFADEIGLHIHPYCNFVVDAGLTCITDQSTVYPGGDTTGYTIKDSAYGRTDFGRLLQHAFTIFDAHGLGRPKTYRAGGWTADANVLLALADNGFVADTSALNWARIEEWMGKELYDWNMMHWAPIGDTSQPYHPSEADPVMITPPTINLLEVPDNGVMIDYVSTDEMTGIFNANWDGQPFAEPRTLMMGFHPAQQFSPAEYKRVDDFLYLADMHLAAKDKGPVVYITLSDVTPAFAH